MNNGWIKLHRKFKEWEWYKKSEMVHLFLHFLILANHEDNKWQGMTIRRGQFITGRNQLSIDTGLSPQIIRSCIKRLKSTSTITIKSTNKFSLISVLNWEKYQCFENKSTSNLTNKLTSNQPAINQQLTTNNNDNNEKNEKIYKDGSNFSFKDGTVGIKRFGEWVDINTRAKLGYEYLKEIK